MTTTIVTWNTATLTVEIIEAINDKAIQMAGEGKTDNNAIRETEGETNIATRIWTTVADAEEWIAFVEQYGPISATIQT
jgi:hypothetical protein